MDKQPIIGMVFYPGDFFSIEIPSFYPFFFKITQKGNQFSIGIEQIITSN